MNLIASNSASFGKRGINKRVKVAVFGMIAFLTSSACMGDPYDDRIAIVGAGAAGLTSAYLLQKEGYRNVTIFEKEDSVGGVAHTVTVDGKAYDMSTMFVPGGNIAGDGIQPMLKELIDVSGEKLIPAVDFETLNTDTLDLTPLNEFHQDYEPEELARQLIKGLTLMTQYFSCLANQIDPVTCGILTPDNLDEGIHEWGERNGVLAFTRLLTFTADALGGGPTSFAKARWLLVSGAQWTPVEAIRVLKASGLGVEDLPEGTLPNIISLMSANGGEGSQRWWFFENGYQTFWKKLTEKASLKVKLSEPVVSLTLNETADKTSWNVETSKDNYEFDRVIVAAMPRAAVKFLPEGERKELVRTAIVRTPSKDVYLARIAGYDDTDFAEQAGLWPAGFGMGSKELVDPNVGMTIKPIFWQKRHAQNVMLVGTYTLSPDISVEQAYSVVEQYAFNLLSGFEFVEQIAHKRFYFPATPLDIASWRASWSTLQGKDNLYFVGEAFNGSGVPAIASSLSTFIPQYFAVTEPDSE